MKYTSLGRGGVRVSSIGLGFWQAGSRLWGFRDSRVYDAVKLGLEYAVEEGINFLDTAEVYGGGLSEKVLGEAVRGLGRDNFVVASKVAGYRVTSGSIVRGVEGVNRRLGFTVDLIQLHWPPPYPWPLCWAVRGLEEAVSRGLAHYYGFSNFSTKLLEGALKCSRRVEPVSNQVQYSLAFRTPELKLAPFMKSRGLTLIAWSPLAKGALTGLKAPTSPAQRGDKVFSRASRDERLQEALRLVAEKLEASRAQVALAWLIAKGAIPIPGFRDPGRVKEYAGAASLNMGEAEVGFLDSVSGEYVKAWGDDYGELLSLRLTPAILQRIAITLMGGI